MNERKLIPWSEIEHRFGQNKERRGPAEIIQVTKTASELAAAVLDCRHLIDGKGFKIDEVPKEIMDVLYDRYGDVSQKY